MLVLKPARKAIEERDLIYGVIKGSAINHGGLSGGLTVPNPQKQSELLLSAWEDAGIKQESISYLETHGTGTSLGDPIEVEGIKKAFTAFSKTNKTSFCGIGSLKSNLGHLEAAAGIAGLLKIVLSMQKKQLPGSIHCKKLNPRIELKDSPLYIVSRHREWNVSEDQPRIAGVSSFGSGGSNAHVVLEEYRQAEKSEITQDFCLFVLSSTNLERLRAYAGRILSWLEKNQEWVNFSDFVYTFQVGRSAMKERLAIKVRGFRELQSKLKQWLEGEEGLENCWQENSKKAHSKFSNLLKGKSGQQVIDSALEKKDLEQLAMLWILGIEIDWKALYKATPRRISVPSYPFSKNQYWIAGGDKSGIREGTRNRPTLHPLLHENTSDLTEQRFTSTFTGKEFFLTDHQVKEKKVLPGVCYLEMARAAVEKTIGEREEEPTIHLKNVVWAQPIVVDGSAQEVHIGLFGEDDGQIQYEVYTESDNEEGTIVHSQGAAEVKTKEETPPLDIQNLQSQMNERLLSAEDCYQAFKKMGIDYGEGHRGIREIYQGEKQVLARLSLPSSVQDTQSEYVLHPSLMDSALQSSIGLVLNNSSLQSGSEAPPGISKWPSSIGRWTLRLPLPFSLESLEIVAPCTSEMYSWVRYLGGSATPDKVQKLNIDLYDDEGNICVRMRGLSQRLLSDDQESFQYKTKKLEVVQQHKLPSRDSAQFTFTTLTNKPKKIILNSLSMQQDFSSRLANKVQSSLGFNQRIRQRKKQFSSVLKQVDVLTDLKSAIAMRVEGTIPTLNRTGVMTEGLLSYSESFAEYAGKCGGEVLDIGCAYGVATIAALERGAQVLAVDMEHEHLDILWERIRDEVKHQVSTQQGLLPDVDFEDGRFTAIHASRIIHFLRPDDVQKTMQKFYRWLQPGGKLFLITDTPYVGYWKSKATDYEVRKAEGDLWPGYIDNVDKFFDIQDVHGAPSLINPLDPDILRRECTAAGFDVDKVGFESSGIDPEVKGSKFAGMEHVGIIAVKPMYQKLSINDKTFVENKDVKQNIQEEQLSPISETRGVDTYEMFEKIRRKLRESLAHELHVQVEDVDEDMRFTDMGVDSIIGVTWI
ncbi:MAG: methyltransferase domain-containing protein, partial [Planctomycetes bacterium]|nr:methyltransferase domain-containing protein [Planctomycetota bacterium]